MAEIDKDTSEQYQGKTFVFPEKSIGLLSELLLGAFVAVLSDFALENGKRIRIPRDSRVRTITVIGMETGPAFIRNDPRM